jgi:hypothetical protein
VGTDNRRLDVLVAEEFLDGANDALHPPPLAVGVGVFVRQGIGR